MTKVSSDPLMTPTYLAGQILLAMPSIGDSRFHRSAIFIVTHDKEGAMGLMLTQPVPGMNLTLLMDQLGIKGAENNTPPIPVLNGGPVDTTRGFVLHTDDYKRKETVVVNDQFSVTATLDILHAIVKGQGPARLVFALGYAGWTAGQLERELSDNAWLTLPATPALIFDTSADQIWERGMTSLGITPGQLPQTGGRA